MRPQDFYTRSRASRGVLVPLDDQQGGREWVRVRSSQSREFMAAVDDSWLQISADAKAAFSDSAEQKRLRRIRHAKQAAALIAEWSLPPEVDPVDLLFRNPRLRRQLERIAENHALHFGAE